MKRLLLAVIAASLTAFVCAVLSGHTTLAEVMAWIAFGWWLFFDVRCSVTIGTPKQPEATAHPVETCPCDTCADARESAYGVPYAWDGANPYGKPLKCESFPGEIEKLRYDLGIALNNSAGWRERCGRIERSAKADQEANAALLLDVAHWTKLSERLAHLLQRTHCGCVYADCPAHGSFVPEDCELWDRVVKGGKV